MNKKILVASSATLLVLAANEPLNAGETQIVIKDGNSTNRNYDVITDGSGNYVGMLGLCDGAAAAQCAAVKAGSAAAGASDPAVVVALSPNNSATVVQPTAANLNATIVGTVNPTTAANWGVGATGASVPANAITNGGRAQNAEPSAVTNGQLVSLATGLEGKLITLPYANKENMIRAAASTVGSTAVTLFSSQGSGVKTYITSIQCFRSDAGTSAVTVTFSDSASTVWVLPNSGGGGGVAQNFPEPLVTAANATFSFQMGANISTAFCNAQGYTGS